jgi:hypothetical protein
VLNITDDSLQRQMWNDGLDPFSIGEESRYFCCGAGGGGGGGGGAGDASNAGNPDGEDSDDPDSSEDTGEDDGAGPGPSQGMTADNPNAPYNEYWAARAEDPFTNNSIAEDTGAFTGVYDSKGNFLGTQGTLGVYNDSNTHESFPGFNLGAMALGSVLAGPLMGLTGFGKSAASTGISAIADALMSEDMAESMTVGATNSTEDTAANEDIGAVSSQTPEAAGVYDGGESALIAAPQQPQTMGTPVATAESTAQLVDQLLNKPGYTKAGEGIIYL